MTATIVCPNPACKRPIHPAAIEGGQDYFCPFCFAKMDAAGGLLAVPEPGPLSLEDVMWDIHTRPATPASREAQSLEDLVDR